MALVDDIENKQLESFDEAGKKIIERSVVIIAILLSVTAFSKAFPSVDLVSNLLAKSFITASLIFYLLAMTMGLLVIRPFQYKRYRYKLTEMRGILDVIIARKLRFLRTANIVFWLGSFTLAGLTISIIWIT